MNSKKFSEKNVVIFLLLFFISTKIVFAGDLKFNTNGGNVGIGTTTPMETLEVQNANTVGTLQTRLRITDVDSGENPELQFKYDASNHWGIYVDKTNGNSLNIWRVSNLFTILGNGNVGIGTITPAVKLDVNGTVRIVGSLGLGTATPSAKIDVVSGGIKTDSSVTTPLVFSQNDLTIQSGTNNINLTPASSMYVDVTQGTFRSPVILQNTKQVLDTLSSGNTAITISGSANSRTITFKTCAANESLIYDGTNWTCSASGFIAKAGVGDGGAGIASGGTIIFNATYGISYGRVSNTITFSPIYGSTANTIAQGNTVINVNTTGNLTGGATGTAGGGLNPTLNTIMNPTFTTSVTTPVTYGSTAASGTLTLSSTTNATKGKILFGTSAYDEVNNRLGIGTTTPSFKLSVVSSGSGNNVTSIFSNSNTTAGNYNFINVNQPVAAGGSYSAYIGINDAGILKINSDSTTASHLIITSAGNVGINTISPSYLLDVNGIARATTVIGSTAVSTPLISNAANISLTPGTVANSVDVTQGTLNAPTIKQNGVQVLDTLTSSSSAITVSGNNNSRTLGFKSCAANETLLWNGTDWVCTSSGFIAKAGYGDGGSGIPFGGTFILDATYGISYGRTGNKITFSPVYGSTVNTIAEGDTVINVNTTGNLTGGATGTAGGGLNPTLNTIMNPTFTTSVTTPVTYGSSAASGTLNLKGTSNATAGNVIINANGGNVGIGTTTPGYGLDVNGTLRVSNDIYQDRAMFIRDFNGTADSWWGWYAWDKEFQFNKRSSANAFVNNIFTANWDTGNFNIVGGSVGIGTASAPSAKLDVVGGGIKTDSSVTTPLVFNQNALTIQSGINNIIIDPATGYGVGINKIPVLGRELDVGGEIFQNGYQVIDDVVAGGGISISGSTNTRTVHLANSGVTAGTYPKVIVDTYGRVTYGYGTINLGTDVSSVLPITYGGTNSNTFITGHVTYFDGTKLTGNNNLFYDQTNGRLGVGTTTPAVKLQIVGAANGLPATTGTAQPNASIRLGNVVTGGILDVGQNSGTSWLQSTNATDLSQDYPILLNPNGGNVGIGTTTTSAKLDVVGGGIKTDSSVVTPIVMNANTTGTIDLTMQSAAGDIILTTAASYGVGVGTTTPGSKVAIVSNDNKDTGPILNLAGSVVNQTESGRIRFTESVMTPAYYQGAYIQYDGINNIFNIGTHEASDGLTSSDINAISILRANGDVGILKIPSSGRELDVNGEIFQNNLQVLDTITSSSSAITVSGSTNSRTLGFKSCATNETLQWNGTDWMCIASGFIAKAGYGDGGAGIPFGGTIIFNATYGISYGRTSNTITFSPVYGSTVNTIAQGSTAINVNTTGNLTGGATGTAGGGLNPTLNTIMNPTFTTSVTTPIVQGSTAASGTLTLSSTTNATKGKILFGNSAYDEVNNRLGISNVAPTEKLDVTGNIKSSGVVSGNSFVATTSTISPLIYGGQAASGDLTIDSTLSATKGDIIIAPTTGNVGIGTTTPSAKLEVNGGIKVGNDDWISAVDSTGSGVINMFKVNTSNEIEVGGTLNIGTLSLAEDSGAVTVVNMPVSATPTAGTEESYSFSIDSNVIAKIYSESNGLGGIQNPGMVINGNIKGATWAGNTIGVAYGGLGFGTPCANGEVIKSNGTSYYCTNDIGDGNGQWSMTGSNIYYNSGNVGIGTTTPGTNLDIYGSNANLIKITRSSNANANIQYSNTSYGMYAGINPTGQFGIGSNIDLTSAPFIVTPAGNVGINNQSPVNKLEVGGNISATGFVSGTTLAGSVAVTAPLIQQNGVQVIDTTSAGGGISISGSANSRTISLSNSGVTVGTYPKVSVDTYGRVTNGTALIASDIPNLDTAKLTTGTLPILRGGTNATSYTANQFLWYNGTSLVGSGYGATSFLSSAAGTTNYLAKFTSNNAIVNSLIYDNGTNVGIGTTSPGQKLHINNGAILAGTTNSTNGSLILAGYYSGNNDYLFTLGSEYSSGGSVFGFGVKPKTSAAGYISSTALNIPRNAMRMTGGDISFLTAPTQTVAIDSDVAMTSKVTIANDGDVGIGTTSPNNKLAVVGVITSGDDVIPALGSNGGKFAILNGGGSGLYGLLQGVISNGNAFLQVQRVDATATAYNLLLQPNGGNIGIGTTGPSSKLDVVGGGIRTDSSVVTPLVMNANTTGTIDLTLQSAAGNIELLPATGYGVGIGTNAPSQRLTIDQSTYNPPAISGTAQTGALRIQASSGGNVVLDMGTYGAFGTWLQTTNKTDLSLEYPLLLQPNGGNIGIGTTNPSTKLHVVGVTTLTDNINYTGGGYTGSAIGFQAGDSSGAGINMGMGGRTVVGSGESGTTAIASAGVAASTESLLLTSDSDIQIITNLQNGWSYGNRVSILANGNVGINDIAPAEKLEVVGNISANAISGTAVSASTQFVSTVATGTAPMQVTSTTKVANLNVDYLDGYDSSAFTTHNEVTDLGTVIFNQAGTTTADFITKLETLGAFDNFHSIMKATWDYAGNTDISDTGFGAFELAGSVVETWTDNADDTVRGNIHVRVTRPTTGAGGGQILVYNDQGAGYSPGWRQLWTSTTDGTGSGLDADLLDGLHSSSFLQSASGTTNYISKFTSANAIVNSQIFDNGTNVGIGTISPSQKLEVNTAGTTLVTGLRVNTQGTPTVGAGAAIELGSSVNGTNSFAVAKVGSYLLNGTTGGESGHMTFSTINGGAMTEAVRILNTGSVGIGTTGPSSKLDVVGGGIKTDSSVVSPLVMNANATGTIDLTMQSAAGDVILTPAAGYGVGIGTTTPTEELEVNGKMKIGNNTVSGENVTFDGSTSPGMRVANTNGYISITPLNTSWAHIYTDRANFIFDKAVYSVNDTFSSYDADMLLQRAGSTKLTLGSATSTFSGNLSANAIYGTAVSASTQFVSTVATGTAPMQVTSTTPVINLNSDLLDGLHSYNFHREYQATISGISSAGWTNIAYVDGVGLNSKIKLTMGGTTGSVVVDVVADIIVNHSTDIYVRSESGSYTLVTLNITSDTNENFYIQAKTNSVNLLTADVRIYTYGGETITFAPASVSGTTVLTHVCSLHQLAISSTGNTAAGMTVGGNVVWHAGNDGSGSGLNADLLDGVHSTGFMPAAAGTTNYLSKFTAANALGNSQIFDNGTSVGVGTATPGAKLDISDTAGASATGTAIVQSTGGNANFVIRSASTSNYAYQTFNQGGVGKFEMGIEPTSSNFYINNTVQTGATGAAIYIQKSNGYVGINDITPSEKLEVVGNIKANSISGTAVTASTQFVSTVATGTAPMQVTSTTKVANLNSDLLDDRTGTYYEGPAGRAIDITVNGDANTYYPVYWKGTDQAIMKTIQIYRNYAETAPSTWYSATHKGGLNFRFKTNFGGWGGTTYSLETDFWAETYSTMVGAIRLAASSQALVVWLRGGGAVYHVFCEEYNLGAPTIVYTDTDIHAPPTYSDIVGPITSVDTSLLPSVYRSGGQWGESLDHGTRVWSVNNQGSGTGMNADMLDGINSSAFQTALGYTPVNKAGDTMTGDLTSTRYKGVNSLVLNTYATANPTSNVFLYSQPNDRDSWIYLDSADTGSNWGIYHRQIDSAVAGLPANSIGFIGGGTSALKGYISLATGNAGFTGSVTASAFYYSSDRTLKENIKPIENSLTKLLQLTGYTFNWKDDENKTTHIGLVAQEVEKIFPEAVKTDEETGLKSVEYANLTAPIIEGIKDQQSQIDELKKINEAQQRQIDQLLKQVETLIKKK